MFGDLTTPEQQRVAQNYMPQLGGRAPSDINTMMQMLLNNPGLASQAMTMYNERSGNNSNSGGVNGGSRIDDMMTAMMAQDGTPTAAPMPVARPANVQVASANPNNVMPPTKPVELTGEDRVARAGGPGSPRGTTAPTSDPTQVAEGAVDPSMSSIIAKTLASMGIGGGLGYAAYKATSPSKQMPPEVADSNAGVPKIRQSDIVDSDSKPFNPPATSKTYSAAEKEGTQVNNFRDKPNPSLKLSPVDQQFNKAFAGDIEDAEYRDVTPKAVDERKKLTGPKEKDTTDKRPTAKSDEAIEAKDESGKTTTAKEKVKKPKVRVK